VPAPDDRDERDKRYPLLVVDDERDNLDAFRFNFGRQFTVHFAQSGADALDIMRQEPIALVVTDQRMPGLTGLELLHEARKIRPRSLGIIVTAFTDVDVLIEAINLGHIERYVTKPWNRDELRGLLRQTLDKYHLLSENERLHEQLQNYAGLLKHEAHEAFNFGAVVGECAALQSARLRIEQVAPTSSAVLLGGEAGTGKELVARAIHINSPREDRPFVRVSCAAFDPETLERELFGYEEGAFAGAFARRPGRLELADGGTLFLDGVSSLGPELQEKLARALQDGAFERVGGVDSVAVDVRVISSTAEDLETHVANGSFLQDLYYRINVVFIELPPLRDRRTDIPTLVEHFLSKSAHDTGKRTAGITDEALTKLANHTWPGNIRELENVIERALILAQGPQITVDDLDFGKRAERNTSQEDDAATLADVRSLSKKLSDQERDEIMAAVEKTKGNIAHAARALAINRSTLYYRMRKHGLEHLLPTK